MDLSGGVVEAHPRTAHPSYARDRLWGTQQLLSALYRDMILVEAWLDMHAARAGLTGWNIVDFIGATHIEILTAISLPT